jgi:DNA-binding CsgD family transcriptional regulator
MQTYSAHAYSEEHVRAFEWLAQRVVTALVREREDAILLQELGPPQDDVITTDPITRLIEIVNVHLNGLRDRIGAVDPNDLLDPRNAAHQLSVLATECERIQTDLVELLAQPEFDANQILASLTPRERDVTLHLMSNYSNAQIASMLGITEQTVKTHVANILRKLGVTQRSGVKSRLMGYVV